MCADVFFIRISQFLKRKSNSFSLRKIQPFAGFVDTERRVVMNTRSKFSNKALLCFIPAAVGGIFLHFLQLMQIIDTESGFFTEDTLLSFSVYLLVIIAFVLFLVLSFLDKRKKTAFYTRNPGRFTPSQVIMLGFFSLLCSASELLTFSSGESVSGIILVLISAVLYSVIGFFTLSSRRIFPAVGFLLLLLGAVFTVRAAVVFMDHLLIMHLPRQLMLMLGYVSVALFYLCAGRALARIQTKNTRFKMNVFGLTASLFFVILCFGSLLYQMLDTPQRDWFSMFTLLTNALFVLGLLLVFGQTKKVKQE